MASLDATRRLVALFQDLHEDDLVICLLSGGASALMTLPLPGITLMEMQALTGSLLGCGATINEINCLRKHLDQVKAGACRIDLSGAPCNFDSVGCDRQSAKCDRFWTNRSRPDYL